jgi:hypothetical protein
MPKAKTDMQVSHLPEGGVHNHRQRQRQLNLLLPDVLRWLLRRLRRGLRSRVGRIVKRRLLGAAARLRRQLYTRPGRKVKCRSVAGLKRGLRRDIVGGHSSLTGVIAVVVAGLRRGRRRLSRKNGRWCVLLRGARSRALAREGAVAAREHKIGYGVFLGNPAEHLGEGVSGLEGRGEVRHLGNVPGREVLIELMGILKDILQALHIAHIPFANVLVKGGGATKHAVHVDGRGGGPAGEVTVEIVGMVEHVAEVSYLRHVPLAQVAPERPRPTKHLLHHRHARY